MNQILFFFLAWLVWLVMVLFTAASFSLYERTRDNTYFGLGLLTAALSGWVAFYAGMVWGMAQ